MELYKVETIIFVIVAGILWYIISFQYALNKAKAARQFSWKYVAPMIVGLVFYLVDLILVIFV
ncbi:hypothetical protein CP356_06645 [Lactobacillus sp. UMNPBX5]|nr:hypothetical protein CP356_06645 [Lactobacillus sp. UMNPBX5]